MRIRGRSNVKSLRGRPDVEFHGPRVIAYRKSTFRTSEFEDAVQVVEGILERIPQSVILELKETD